MDFVLCFLELMMVLSTGCEIILITTSTEYGYISLLNDSVAIMGSNNIVFGVMACHDVHVALSRDFDNFESNTMELVIGGWSNTKSGLRMKKQGALVVKTSGTILDCNTTKWFSLDWSNDVLKFSVIINGISGPTLLEHGPLSHAINYLGISTGWGAAGLWEFEIPVHSTEVTSLLYDSSEITISPVMNSEMITSSFVNSEVITPSHVYSDVMTSSFVNSEVITPSHVYSDVMTSSFVTGEVITPSYVYSDVMTSSFVNSDIIVSFYQNSDEMTSSPVISDVVTSSSMPGDIILSSSVQNEMITPFATNSDTITLSPIITTSVVSANTDSTAYSGYPTTILPSTQQQCRCRCTKDENSTNSVEISLVVGSIIQYLSLDRKQLSSTKRRFISIRDIRPSSISIGMFGVFILVCFILLIILPDLLIVIKYLHQYLTKAQHE